MLTRCVPQQVFYILARCPYYNEGRKDREKTGIKRLLSNGTYAAAFPLHDVRLDYKYIRGVSSLRASLPSSGKSLF